MDEGGGGDKYEQWQLIMQQMMMSGMSMDDGEQPQEYEIHPRLIELRQMIEFHVYQEMQPWILPEHEFRKLVAIRTMELFTLHPELLPDQPFRPVYRRPRPPRSDSDRPPRTDSPYPQNTPVDDSWLAGTNVHVTKQAKELYRQDKKAMEDSTSEATRTPRPPRTGRSARRSRRNSGSVHRSAQRPNIPARGLSLDSRPAAGAVGTSSVTPSNNQTKTKTKIKPICTQEKSPPTKNGKLKPQLNLAETQQPTTATPSGGARPKQKTIDTASKDRPNRKPAKVEKGALAFLETPVTPPTTDIGDMEHPTEGWVSVKHGAARTKQPKEDVQHAIQRPLVKTAPTEKTKTDQTVFPLSATHSFVIACGQCLVRDPHLDQYRLIRVVHECTRDTLAVRAHNSQTWLRIRFRDDHCIKGGYILCRDYADDACEYGEHCSYAHSNEELILWNLEKRKKFSIDRFVKKHLSTRTPEDAYTDESAEISDKDRRGHRIYLDFSLDRPALVTAPPHVEQQRTSSQTFSSSKPVENGSQPVVKGSQPVVNGSQPIANGSQPNANGWQPVVIGSQPVVNDLQPVVNGSPPNITSSQILVPWKSGTSKPEILSVCKRCWKNGQLVSQDRTKPSRCAAAESHAWYEARIFLLLPEKKPIRQPTSTKKGQRFSMCRHVKEKGVCTYINNQPCMYAHSESELEVWKWMQENQVDQINEIAREVPPPSAPRYAPVTRQSHYSHGPVLTVDCNYCKYCGVTCSSPSQLRQHCSSRKHTLRVNTDSECQWDYRPPPCHVQRGAFKLCPELSTKECRFVHSTQENNLCGYAHSQDELEEWKRRWSYRLEKARMARDSHLYSQLDDLLQSYRKAADGITILTESVHGVIIECSENLSILTEERNQTLEWNFRIKSDQKLQTVGLLLPGDRNRFSLHCEDSGDQDHVQLLDGLSIQQTDTCVQVQVRCRPGAYGNFKQWVVFDFGSRPVLVRKLQVDVARKDVLDRVQTTRMRFNSERWTSENAQIVTFPYRRTRQSFEEELLKKYKAPYSAADVVDQKSLLTPINEENYRHKMHKLIRLEELQRADLISGFGHFTELKIMQVIQEDNIFMNSMPGQLFARLDLPRKLNKDTTAGRLILMSVQTVLLKNDNQGNTLYEAAILNKENFDFDGKAPDHMYICLSQRCVSEWNLSPNAVIRVQIQFQMDRLPFCKWHMALDELEDLHNIFPRATAPVWERESQIVIRRDYLNTRQRDVVQCIFDHCKNNSLPIVACGPFGTGKTELMVQAAQLLLQESGQDKIRILICTHANSAADLYIEKQLHAFKERSPTTKLMRIYHAERRLTTVREIVRNYCCLSDDGSSLVMPAVCDVKQQNLVVTTFSTAAYLLNMKKLKGHFTHIFIDEAAQALECEVLTPMALASRDTCVVLAGDHMQMRQEVYCPEARQQGFDRSVIEHLQRYYKRQPANIGESMCHFLNVNYRTTQGILKFLASVFYGDPNCLIAVRNTVEQPTSQPCLNFFAAYGHEEQDADSTSWYNIAEVNEIVIRVSQLCNYYKQSDIGVVAVEEAQVTRIRGGLRRVGLRDVNVVVPMTVQGNEFAVVFISTVKTRHCFPSPDETNNMDFLTNKHILNTALTRSKFYVGVVGDPVALCTMGDCSPIWMNYINECSTLNSISPSTCVVMDDIYMAEASKQLELESQIDVQHDNTAYCDLDANVDSQCDDTLEADEILRQLSIQAKKITPEDIPAHKLSEDQNPLKVSCIRIKELQGHAVPLSSTSTGHPRLRKEWKRRLLGADDWDKQYNSDSSDSSEPDENEHREDGTKEQSPQQLRHLIESEPSHYKRCILLINSPSVIRGKVLCPIDDVHEIAISSRRRCGRAFHNDEVCIEIKPTDSEDRVFDDDAVLPQGEVIGILNRTFDPLYKKIVCTVDEDNAGVMIPLNIGFPRMISVVSKDRVGTNKRPIGSVCVYSFTSNKEIRFRRYEKITRDDGSQNLFLVRFLKWEPNFTNPLCVVIGVLQMGLTITDGLAILDVEHFVPGDFKSEVRQAVKDHIRDLTPDDKGRLNYCQKVCFTIDPEGSEDLDDAVSIEKNPDGTFLLGIHIADVSNFVLKDSVVDKEARARCTTFYPVGKGPIPMLPEEFSNNICSLLPHKDRNTITVFMTVNSEAVISDIRFRQCKINSKKRLTYAEAEAIIESDAMTNGIQTDLTISIRRLNKIAEKWRRQRLGDEAHYHGLDRESADHPKSHLLIQELMIVANQKIAERLISAFPNCVPLRSQEPPKDMELWKEKFQEIASNTFVLKRPFLQENMICECTDECSCLPIAKQDSVCNLVGINKPVWEKVTDAITATDNNNSLFSLASPDILPEASIAKKQMHMLQERAMYVCSGDISDKTSKHHSLQMEAYTHFTSPIRRYIDLAVHRLIKAMINDQPCPYSQDEISEICRKCSDTNQRAKKYENATEKLQLAVSLKESPASMHTIVDSVNATALQVLYPGIKCIPGNLRNLRLPYLHSHGQPLLAGNNIDITWNERIYDATKQDQTASGTDDMLAASGTIERHPKHQYLNPSPFVEFIPETLWKKLMKAIRQHNVEEALKSCLEISEAMHTRQPDHYVDDVSSEQSEMVHRNQFCYFTLKVAAASVLKMQLSAEPRRGLLSPCMQLFSLTDTLDICLEHRTDPVRCFANVGDIIKVKKQYDSMTEYRDRWLQCVAMEAATSSVKGDKSITIHNVNITWIRLDDGKISGSFYLTKDFCKSRFIPCTQTEGEDDSGEVMVDYLCVRYSGIGRKQPIIGTRVDNYEFGASHTWTVHCASSHVNDKRTDHVAVGITPLRQTTPIPAELMMCNHKATVEMISKSLPIRREEAALKHLTVTKDALVHSIALGTDTPLMDATHLREIERFIRKPVPSLYRTPANAAQQDAIRKAMTQSFTLIQGPPGTGKTVTGVRLAYLLNSYNRTKPVKKIRSQLLICGPSNDSVDVIAVHMSQMNDEDCPLIVRVYSSLIEDNDFPLPLHNTMGQKHSGYTRNSEVTQFALHYLIRNPRECRLADEILAFDRKVRARTEEKRDLSLEEKTEYGKLIASAKKLVLAKKEIILCTCHTSSSGIIAEGTNIKQLIIDECGMCTEPQCMVPIVSAQPEQIILIGDHKQLQPIIIEPKATKLGLNVSLFERYEKKAHVLTEQYRMHEAIASFPSRQFYNDQLQPGLETQRLPSRLRNFWQGGRKQPIMFIHTVGQEEALTVATAEGSEQSKSNMEEVKQVTRIVLHLLRNYRVKAKDVLVMSQYRAQRAKIEEDFAKKNNVCNINDVKISTVVAAQGRENEWVVWSTVRSLPKSQIETRPSAGWSRRHLGFITDAHQVNVALTRAKKGLIIIGNKNLLESNPLWKDLFHHYQQNKAIIKAADFLPRY